MNKSIFSRGFESFGKQIPLQGAPQAAAPQPIAPVAAPAPARLSLSGPARQQTQYRGQAIPVAQKGDPNAPPCPVCRG